MATRAIKPKRDDTIFAGWQSMPETAPSVMREDQPTVARILAMVGVLFLAAGGLAMVAPSWNLRYVISPAWGFFVLSNGLVMVLFHAFVDRDPQFRRVYTVVGLGLAALGVALRLLPLGGSWGGLYLPYGIAAVAVALLFLLAVLRQESDARIKRLLLQVTGGLGALMIGAGLVIGFFNQGFLLREGTLHLVLGLCYVSAFLGMLDIGGDQAYQAGMALGVAGGIAFVVCLVRSLFFSGGGDFFIPAGLILITMSFINFAISLGICSDWPLVVLIRRELAAYFYSPIAYLVILGAVAVGWYMFWTFIGTLILVWRGQMIEPIVSRYIVNLIPVIYVMFAVPILTMRLLSEEQRAGTLEVLLTAPVNELTVVLSKFFACLFIFLLNWIPWWLYLVALRVMGGEEFDYRPILSFMIALVASGSGFIAMGLLFSALTRNQIIAAVLTFVGMVAHLGFYLIRHTIDIPQGTVWQDILNYCSFIDLWFTTLDGVLAPRYLLFHISATIFFLFLTVKVLEARKWR